MMQQGQSCKLRKVKGKEMRTSNVLQLLIESFGALGGDEGILFGDREQEVTGIQVCWMASLDAIQHAGRLGTIS